MTYLNIGLIIIICGLMFIIYRLFTVIRILRKNAISNSNITIKMKNQDKKIKDLIYNLNLERYKNRK